MPARISKVTLVLDTWDSGVRFYRHRVSFDVPVEDVAFYEAAMERWHTFSEAFWNGGPKFNEVAEKPNDPVVG